MTAFRALLLLILVVLSAYTGVVIANHGLGLLPIFFGEMLRMTWAGQFNLDFFSMLVLSATWTAWRHGFSPGGLALGFLALVGGGLFLSVYLLVLTWQTHGDVKRILLGRRHFE